MNRRLAGSLVLVAATTAVLSVSGPASATPLQPIRVSADGTTFARTLAAPLFDGAFRIVPQDSVTHDLWVRNTGATAGRMRIDLLRPTSNDPALAAALTIAVSDVDGAGVVSSTTIADAGRCTVLLTGITLAAGQTAHLSASASLGDLTGKQAQDSTADFDLRVVLSDASVPAPTDPTSCALRPGDDTTEVPGPHDGVTPSPTPSPTGRPDGLAHTGVENLGRALGTSLIALLVGSLLVLVARRRRRKDEDA